MKNRFWILPILPILFGACSGGDFRDQDVEISAVPIEVESYLGLWYEIARYPNWFENGCENVTAEYALRDDGKVSVKNSCEKNGEIEVANGVAHIEGEGMLGVTFTPWIPGLWGDYWVLGRQDYDIAVVGNPKGSTGWILARTPVISEEDRAWAEGVLDAAGYDLDGLENVTQAPR